MADAANIRKASVVKVDTGLGLVFGWGLICTEKGEDHYDLQGDHVPETLMVEATTDFMISSRESHDMHMGKAHGMVVHSFPLTAEIAKAMGIETEKTGWMVAVKPTPEILAKYLDGTYTGFSIGGGCAYDLEEGDN